MKITDLSESFSQEPEIIQEFEKLSLSEASEVVGGVTLNASETVAVSNETRNPPSGGCGGAFNPIIPYFVS